MNRARMIGMAWAAGSVMLAGMGSGCAADGGRNSASNPYAAPGASNPSAPQPQTGAPLQRTPPPPPSAYAAEPSGAGASGPQAGAGAAAAPGASPNAALASAAASVRQNPESASVGQYGGQKSCPVTGEPLGSMGPPIPVAVGASGRTVYVCCESCVAAVQADPDKYVWIVNGERNAGRSDAGADSDRGSSAVGSSRGSGGCASGSCGRCGR